MINRPTIEFTAIIFGTEIQVTESLNPRENFRAIWLSQLSRVNVNAAQRTLHLYEPIHLSRASFGDKGVE